MSKLFVLEQDIDLNALKFMTNEDAKHLLRQQPFGKHIKFINYLKTWLNSQVCIVLFFT